MQDYDDHEPEHASSPTAHLLEELSLYGYRPFSDEADPRPLPEERIASGAIADMFDRRKVTLAALTVSCVGAAGLTVLAGTGHLCTIPVCCCLACGIRAARACTGGIRPCSAVG